MTVIVEVYRIARRLPIEERYELSSQLRRAAVSVAANLAESCARATPRDRLKFIVEARASLVELDTLLAAVEVLKYADNCEVETVYATIDHCGRLVSGLRRRYQSLVTSHQSPVTSH
jgi:four helix bundle protein